MKFKSLLAVAIAASLTIGCARIETGEVGVRVGFDKQVNQTELQPGTFNQTIFGDVLKFQTKDVSAVIDNITPLAADNSTVAEFDMTVVYSLNPSSVADLYIEKNRSFHATSQEGDVLLMYSYIQQLARNAAYKAVRPYESLKLNDNRPAIEEEIKRLITEALAAEGLGSSLTLEQVLVRKITPAASIIESANALVQAQNDLKRKNVEVDTAEAESRRIAALNANSGATQYMEAMALVNISEAVKEGKVNTIILPYDFRGIVNVGDAQRRAQPAQAAQ